VLGLAISLASAMSWGISDFLGGTQSRRMPVVAVLVVSQPVGLVLALAMVPALGADPLPAEKLAIGFAAGAAAVAGLGAFYKAMAVGTISVVAPVAALGVVVPVAVGLARGENPEAVQLLGLAVAVAGVVILSYEEDSEGAPVARRSIALAALAGLGIGLFFTGLDLASADRPGWTIVSARLGGVAAIAAAALAVRPSLARVPAALWVLLAIGVFDILANTLFAVASTRGLLPVVAVGGSMYPAFTIALAHIVLGERLIVSQRVGVVLALAGVALIAAGG
jgi:drug/metabolite transporter (DMT)-like permease